MPGPTVGPTQFMQATMAQRAEEIEKLRALVAELTTRLEEVRKERDEAREALTVLAGLPDRKGQTHCSTLHDVPSMREYARKMLDLV